MCGDGGLKAVLSSHMKVGCVDVSSLVFLSLPKKYFDSELMNLLFDSHARADCRSCIS